MVIDGVDLANSPSLQDDYNKALIKVATPTCYFNVQFFAANTTQLRRTLASGTRVVALLGFTDASAADILSVPAFESILENFLKAEVGAFEDVSVQSSQIKTFSVIDDGDDGDDEETSSNSVVVFVAVGIVLAVIAVVIIIVLLRSRPNKQPDDEADPPKQADPPEARSEYSREDNEAPPVAENSFANELAQNILDELDSSSDDLDLANVDLFGDPSVVKSPATTARAIASAAICGVKLPDDFEPDVYSDEENSETAAPKGPGADDVDAMIDQGTKIAGLLIDTLVEEAEELTRGTPPKKRVGSLARAFTDEIVDASMHSVVPVGSASREVRPNVPERIEEDAYAPDESYLDAEAYSSDHSEFDV